MSKKINQHCNEPRPISGEIWCDDHTDIYIGGCEKITKLRQQQNHPTSTKFKTQGTCCDYLYFVCWSNDSGANGFLAELQGGNTVLSGDQSGWEVFPTGIDRDTSGQRPSTSLVVEQIKKSHCCGWKPVFKGQKNDGSNKPFPNIQSTITNSANYIWYNSGNQPGATYPASPYIPFIGYNHDEFLIFRLPVSALYKKDCKECKCEPCDCEKCDCDCSCHGCNDNGEKQQKKLLDRAKNKSHTIVGKNNINCGQAPFVNDKKCSPLDASDIKLCFYLHYGDSPADHIETHDTEVIYLTVCNPFSNISFRKLRITELTITPIPGIQSNGEPEIRLVPDQLIQFDCLEACSCLSTELSLITRGAAPRKYTIGVKYCIDDISINQDKTGENSFEIILVNS